MNPPESEKCPACGRPLYDDRPNCMYCDYERPMDAGLRLQMKKKLVARALGNEEDATLGIADDDPTIIKIKNCPNCHKALAPNTGFCTACGTKINLSPPEPTPIRKKKKPAVKPPPTILPVSDNLDQPQRELPQNIEVPFISPDFFADKTKLPWNTAVAWGVSFLFFLLAALLPFGAKPGVTRTGAPVGVEVPFPLVLWALYSLVFVFIAFTLFDLNFPVPARFLNTNYLLAAQIVICMATVSEVFSNPASAGVLLVLFLAAFIYLAKFSAKYSQADFWSLSITVTTVVMLIITPYLKTEVLSDTGMNPIDNKGFSLHVIATLLLLAGCVFHVKKMPEVEPPDVYPG